MLTIRTFCNTDSPALLTIWEKRAALNPEHFRPLSMELLEQHVLGKPFFDRNGLFLAFNDHQPVGFAHAAFGPNEGHSDIDSTTGVVCLIMVLPDDPNRSTVAAELLKACEQYLVRRGAKRIYGGAVRPAAPFYMGLYGGSEPLGVFESDKVVSQLYRQSNYEIVSHTLLFRTSLINYRPPITAKTVQWRRSVSLHFTDLPTPSHWWEACMMCNFTWLELQGRVAHEPKPVATVTARITDSREMPDFDLAQHASSFVTPDLSIGRTLVAGLMDIRVQDDRKHKGLGTYMLGEMVRELQRRYVTLFEAQAAEENEPLIKLLNTMRWNIADHGAVYLKTVTG